MFTSTISLILALAPATLFAAPTATFDTIAPLAPRDDLPASLVEQLKKTNALCDLSQVQLPAAPTPLPAISQGLTLRHIAVGRGTQNYTCASSTSDVVPVANGAIATLFNVTCDYARLNANVMTDITNLALAYAVPSGPNADTRISGHHEFTDKKIPLFNLKTANTNYGYVQAKPDDVKSAAPTNASKGTNSLGSVPWLKLNAVEGDYKEVFRVHTAGGVAPKTCAGISGAFTIDYSAQYWFYA